MLSNYLEKMLRLYERTDAILITDSNGYIEYSSMVSSDINNFKNAEVTGKHILEVYTSLTEDTSSIMRVLKTGQPIIDEKQIVKNCKGETLYLINSTFPIVVNKKVIGAIEASVYLDELSEEEINHINDKSIKNLYTLDDIITSNESLLEIKNRIRKIATNNSPVLIVGETGTGKELVAQSIHSHSKRSDGPFVSQNCAAIPDTLLESILFGTAKGSYTGAEEKKGMFEVASEGTLFLDEINSMSMGMQSKILKVLEDKKVRRVGDSKEIKVDVRVVSAMNKDPVSAIEKNIIRSDLFYRLSVVQIKLPPLRDRKEDIAILVDSFINKYNREMQRNITGISDLVKGLFDNYAWPGNVRELRNIVESAFNIAKSNTITMQDVPEYLFNSRVNKNKTDTINIGDHSLPDMIENYEKKILLTAISESKNMVDAAKKLKISRQSLQYKLNKYDIQ
ncbi:arginine utilization regulatory protein [Dethiosulfatibacter aminovorans DSM 17477]|uniref:Arginine utilization regulatory protein n=1 Tax=Dethiosulfatibacter aminovorans DSM 17477 TaxID=1121476 RepID=A0A1M6MGV1_9FIRM|nr:sigma 54-interacting transcriptional regulator [Dethiosulfatibacter aminovorans]SHJ82668.1 arginine utilization regulatory protein [Dethiosulfatibacter aminovorans DSM 17477]